jgi:hypothetical protein
MQAAVIVGEVLGDAAVVFAGALLAGKTLDVAYKEASTSGKEHLLALTKPTLEPGLKFTLPAAVYLQKHAPSIPKKLGIPDIPDKPGKSPPPIFDPFLQIVAFGASLLLPSITDNKPPVIGLKNPPPPVKLKSPCIDRGDKEEYLKCRMEEQRNLKSTPVPDGTMVAAKKNDVGQNADFLRKLRGLGKDRDLVSSLLGLRAGERYSPGLLPTDVRKGQVALPPGQGQVGSNSGVGLKHRPEEPRFRWVAEQLAAEGIKYEVELFSRPPRSFDQSPYWAIKIPSLDLVIFGSNGGSNRTFIFKGIGYFNGHFGKTKFDLTQQAVTDPLITQFTHKGKERFIEMILKAIYGSFPRDHLRVDNVARREEPDWVIEESRPPGKNWKTEKELAKELKCSVKVIRDYYREYEERRIIEREHNGKTKFYGGELYHSPKIIEFIAKQINSIKVAKEGIKNRKELKRLFKLSDGALEDLLEEYFSKNPRDSNVRLLRERNTKELSLFYSEEVEGFIGKRIKKIGEAGKGEYTTKELSRRHNLPADKIRTLGWNAYKFEFGKEPDSEQPIRVLRRSRSSGKISRHYLPYVDRYINYYIRQRDNDLPF